MATTIDPRMISGDKTLRLPDARFTYLSAFQSQISFLSSINFKANNIDATGNLNADQINSNNINNTGNLNTDTGTINSLNTGNISNSNLVTTTDISIGNNTTLVNLTATGNVVTDFTILSTDTDYVFSDADKSKVIHFDTTTTTEISAIFPNTLSDGFNVGLINAGIGVIYLSGEDVINAPGSINSEIYTGVFIYKASGSLFGVGSLE
jgi:hypothetical protein